MICFDTSALIKRYKREDHSDWIDQIMAEDHDWCASSLIATEAAIALSREPALESDLPAIDGRLAADLEAFVMVPVDATCLVRAVEIGRKLRLRTLDAIHLAAVDQLPAVVAFVTLDDRQREAAEDLGLKVLAPPV